MTPNFTDKQTKALQRVEAGTPIDLLAQELETKGMYITSSLKGAAKKYPSFEEFSKSWPVCASHITPGVEKGNTRAMFGSTLDKIADETGLPRSKLQILKQRVNLVEETKLSNPIEITDTQMRSEVKKKIAMVLGYIDNFSLATAKTSELSSIFKVLFEANQLLEGKPTTIMSREDRIHITDLIPKLLEEAQRRGISVIKDVEGQVIQNVPAKEKPLRSPPTQGSWFPNGATKAYFDRHKFKWPGDPDAPRNTKWKDIDEEGY